MARNSMTNGEIYAQQLQAHLWQVTTSQPILAIPAFLVCHTAWQRGNYTLPHALDIGPVGAMLRLKSRGRLGTIQLWLHSVL